MGSCGNVIITSDFPVSTFYIMFEFACTCNWIVSSACVCTYCLSDDNATRDNGLSLAWNIYRSYIWWLWYILYVLYACSKGLDVACSPDISSMFYTSWGYTLTFNKSSGIELGGMPMVIQYCYGIFCLYEHLAVGILLYSTSIFKIAFRPCTCTRGTTTCWYSCLLVLVHDGT